MSVDHVTMLLKNVPLFENLNEEELASIAPLFQQRNYKKGAFLFFEGDEGNEFYLIESGFVKIAKLEDDKEITLALFRDGDFFGEMALVQKGTRSASAETLETSKIYKLNRKDFHEFMLSSPKLCLSLLEISMERLRKANEQIHDLTFLDVRSRILKNIHRLSEDYGKPVQGGLLIDLKLTHQQLANIVGTVRETVTKVLQELQDDHVISIEKKRIIIKNLTKLKLY
jgi:CRP/FNR family cyclic AMP-dependent transcriptional regulator